jgi:hypothetical protein
MGRSTGFLTTRSIHLHLNEYDPLHQQGTIAHSEQGTDQGAVALSEQGTVKAPNGAALEVRMSLCLCEA